MNYYSLIPSAPSYNPAAFSSCCRISSANHCGCRTLNSGEMRCSLFIDSIREAGFDRIEDLAKTG